MTSAALDMTLAALADPVRRRAVELLQGKARRAGDLARKLRLSPSRMSQHLRVLRRSGLIEDDGLEEDARVRLYRLKPQPLAALRGWLEEVEAFWALELAAFKQHAEHLASAERRATAEASGLSAVSSAPSAERSRSGPARTTRRRNTHSRARTRRS